MTVSSGAEPLRRGSERVGKSGARPAAAKDGEQIIADTWSTVGTSHTKDSLEAALPEA